MDYPTYDVFAPDPDKASPTGVLALAMDATAEKGSCFSMSTCREFPMPRLWSANLLIRHHSRDGAALA